MAPGASLEGPGTVIVMTVSYINTTGQEGPGRIPGENSDRVLNKGPPPTPCKVRYHFPIDREMARVLPDPLQGSLPFPDRSKNGKGPCLGGSSPGLLKW